MVGLLACLCPALGAREYRAISSLKGLTLMPTIEYVPLSPICLDEMTMRNKVSVLLSSTFHVAYAYMIAICTMLASGRF